MLIGELQTAKYRRSLVRGSDNRASRSPAAWVRSYSRATADEPED